MRESTIARSRRIAVTGTVMAAVSAATITLAQPAEAGKPTATATAVVFRTAQGHTSLPAKGSARAAVVKMTVPAGAWLVNARATAVNFSPENYVRCRIYLNGSPAGVGSTTTIGAGPGQSGTHADSLDPMAVIRTNTPATVSLICSHDYTTASAGNIYLEDSAMSAIKPGPIDG